MVNIVEPMKRIKDKVKLEGPRPRTDTRVCHKCGKAGHIRSRCLLVKREKQGANFVFAIGNGVDAHANHCILDSGSSRHLINDSSLLTNPTLCKRDCLTAATDGSMLRVTQQGTVDLQVTALGVVNNVLPLNVQYAEKLERNIFNLWVARGKGMHP